MKIALGADHAGYQLKDFLIERLEKEGHLCINIGANSGNSVDYPDFSSLVCRAVLNGEAEAGILVCGTGIGMSIAANKFEGIRAALCADTYSAKVSREHNNANVLCLGERVTGVELAWEITKHWLSASFSEGPRHINRLRKIEAIEQDQETHG